MFKLSPSILAADFSRMGEEIEAIEKAGADYVHIDVMDGRFVPSIAVGLPMVASLRKRSKLVFDVHLMIEEPIRYLKEFKEAGADILSVHVEACRHLDKTIDEINGLGMRAGAAVNPSTPVSALQAVLPKLDLVLIMTVNPGFGGQKLIPCSLNKITQVRDMIEESGLAVDIEVDGGVALHNTRQILLAGANVIVAGTAVFRGNVDENVKAFKEVFAHASQGN